MLWCCSLMSVLDGERREFEAACEKHEKEKQAVMEKVQARRATVRGILEAAVLPSAETPARQASKPLDVHQRLHRRQGT